MDLTTFIMTLLGLQLICLFVGSKSAKETKTQEDYFLAGKQIRFFPLMMTFLATQVGGGLILGAAEEAYKFGWSVFLYPLGACLGLVLLGVGVGRKLSQFKVSTVAQIFEVVYKSSTLKKNCLHSFDTFPFCHLYCSNYSFKKVYVECRC